MCTTCAADLNIQKIGSQRARHGCVRDVDDDNDEVDDVDMGSPAGKSTAAVPAGPYIARFSDETSIKPAQTAGARNGCRLASSFLSNRLGYVSMQGC